MSSQKNYEMYGKMTLKNGKPTRKIVEYRNLEEINNAVTITEQQKSIGRVRFTPILSHYLNESIICVGIVKNTMMAIV